MDNQDKAITGSRRSFGTAAAAGAMGFLIVKPEQVRGSQANSALTIGLIGIGGRGLHDSGIAAKHEFARIAAICDIYDDRLAEGRKRYTGAKEYKNYKELLASDIDAVMICTPAFLHPEHFEAAVAAKKHIFMEKPCAVDGPGIRRVIAAAKDAETKRLCIVAGTQRRSQPSYIEAIGRIHKGELGRLMAGRCYWNQGSLWNVEADPKKTDVENQIRNWLYYAWLSGDHIVEQHVHQLDVMNWAFGTHPVLARGVGGRQARVDPKFGHIFDHFGIEYVYPPAPGDEAFGERFVLSMCRQQDGTVGRVEESLTATDGVALLRPGFAEFTGRTPWKFSGPNPNPYVEEHKRLIAAIQSGATLNEGQQVAYSTLVAIMGRMAAYTGQEVTWDQALNSKEELMPESVDFGPRPVPPVAVPGVTKLG